MSKALVIGAAGFVGNYLIDEIKKTLLCDVIATKLKHESINREDVYVEDLNILVIDEIKDILNRYRPLYIFHLAAQSSVSVAWKNPAMTADINIIGSLNVLDAIRELDVQPKVLMIGSGEEYGYVDEARIDERVSPRPGNIYAATKACQNMIATVYCREYGMNAVMVRPFNHIGPNQSPIFVISDFCKQVVSIEKKLQEPIIRVGNLSAKRDFTDVRDVVKAYVRLIQFGKPGETYNVGRGKAVRISEILDIILRHSDAEIAVEVDKARLRPVDVPVIEPDTQKIYAATGWEAQYTLEESIADILEYWRKQI